MTAAAEPFELLDRVGADRPAVLLHSCGAGRVLWFEGPRDVLEISGEPAGLGGAFEEIDRFLDRHSARPVAGFLGYDLRDAAEPLARGIADDLPMPAVYLIAFDAVREWPGLGLPDPVPVAPARHVCPHFDRREYERRVAAVVEHIRAGDVFQANLTQPFTGRFDDDPRRLFRRLCAASPAPFAGYCQTADGSAVLSASPEEFLWVDGDSIRSTPIKGTRPRGAEPDRDAELLRELLGSEKDQAELAMIVDLMRNDIGRVARIGSVRVGPFPEHASFAQVHHLFATVSAELRTAVSFGELLRATFPAGSITGAPKLRCMEILETLETVRRGVYTGALGWFGPGRRLHLNVAIRTMTIRDGVVRLNAGGGVTADSDPAAEYDETLHKAAGMLQGLGTTLETRTTR